MEGKVRIVIGIKLLPLMCVSLHSMALTVAFLIFVKGGVQHMHKLSSAHALIVTR